MRDISCNLEYPWEWDSISNNPNLTIDMISENPLEDWNLHFISYNSNIKMNDILNNVKMPWNWGHYNSNNNIMLNITIKILLDGNDKNWYFNFICDNYKKIEVSYVEERSGC